MEIENNASNSTENQISVAFNYGEYSLEQRNWLREKANEIRQQGAVMLVAALAIGRKLVEVRIFLGAENTFSNWIKTEFNWSRSTAYNYISLVEMFSNLKEGDEFFDEINLEKISIPLGGLYYLAQNNIDAETAVEIIKRNLEGESFTVEQTKSLASQTRKPAKSRKLKNISPKELVKEQEEFGKTDLDFALEKYKTTEIAEKKKFEEVMKAAGEKLGWDNPFLQDMLEAWKEKVYKETAEMIKEQEQRNLADAEFMLQLREDTSDN